MDEAQVCPECGAAVAGGAAGCLSLYRERMGLESGMSAYAGPGRMAWDAYCVQHPARYCVSVKSLIAHLGGLCWALEFGGQVRGYDALNRLPNGTLAVDKPALPPSRGALTIADVAGLEDAEHMATVERWSRAVWEAYAALHPFARQWIAAALPGG
jgi:hypothetical protein